MRLAVRQGTGHLVNRIPLQPCYTAARTQYRTINTQPKHERPPAIIELINLQPQPNPKAQNIAVLGGGITGLSSAWNLSRLIPEAKITIFEKQDRLGGWLDSDIVKVEGGEVLFEWGPRSLRPDFAGSGMATLHMLFALGLAKDVVGTPKSAPASYNRFIYYGNRLVQMPGANPSLPTFFNIVRNARKILTEPIFTGVLGSLFAEHWVQTRPLNMTDESVGDFIRRRFGKTAADNIASAFFHGIYAGDLYKLSVRTLLPVLWHMETRDPEGAGIIMEMVDLQFKEHRLMPYKNGRYLDLLSANGHDDPTGQVWFHLMHQENSVYTLGKGLQQLNQAIQDYFQAKKSQVEIRTGTEIQQLKFDPETKKTKIIANGHNIEVEFDYIVSTLPARQLADLAHSSAKSRGATLNPDTENALQDADKAVNVGVVNLYYTNPNLIPSHQRGFGYLIPRSVATDENPERALGVIFGSESSGSRGPEAIQTVNNTEIKQMNEKSYQEALKHYETHKFANEADRQDLKSAIDTVIESSRAMPDEVVIRRGQDTAPGTKLTVMLGGHWWDGWSADDLPSENDMIRMAKSLLSRHLKITEDPVVAQARMNRECIPQYHVGYRQRMASVHRGLMEEFQGRLKVVGPWWQGAVGVNDCVMNAHITAFNIREGWDEETGLKEYTDKEKWLVFDRRANQFHLDQRG